MFQIASSADFFKFSSLILKFASQIKKKLIVWLFDFEIVKEFAINIVNTAL